MVLPPNAENAARILKNNIVFLIILFAFPLFAQNRYSINSVINEAQILLLDEAITESMKYLTNRLDEGTKISIIYFESESENLSQYCLDESSIYIINNSDLYFIDIKKSLLNKLDFGGATDEKMLEAGRMLGAETVISGSISKLGENYRFIIQALSVENAIVQGMLSFTVASDDLLANLLMPENTYVEYNEEIEEVEQIEIVEENDQTEQINQIVYLQNDVFIIRNNHNHRTLPPQPKDKKVLPQSNNNKPQQNQIVVVQNDNNRPQPNQKEVKKTPAPNDNNRPQPQPNQKEEKKAPHQNDNNRPQPNNQKEVKKAPHQNDNNKPQPNNQKEEKKAPHQNDNNKPQPNQKTKPQPNNKAR